MIYRFQILTHTDIYEGWAHHPAEMSATFAAQHLGVDFEVFLTNAPQILTLGEYRAYLHSGMTIDAIFRLDAELAVTS